MQIKLCKQGTWVKNIIADPYSFPIFFFQIFFDEIYLYKKKYDSMKIYSGEIARLTSKKKKKRGKKKKEERKEKGERHKREAY